MINRNYNYRHSCVVLDFKRNDFDFFLLGLSYLYEDTIQVKEAPFYTKFAGSHYSACVLNFTKDFFFACVKIVLSFFYFKKSVNMVSDI